MVAERQGELPGQIPEIDQTGLRDVGEHRPQDIHREIPTEDHIHPPDIPLVG